MASVMPDSKPEGLAGKMAPALISAGQRNAK